MYTQLVNWWFSTSYLIIYFYAYQRLLSNFFSQPTPGPQLFEILIPRGYWKEITGQHWSQSTRDLLLLFRKFNSGKVSPSLPHWPWELGTRFIPGHVPLKARSKFEGEEERHERQNLNWWRSRILNCPLAEDCDDRSSEPRGWVQQQ